MDYEEFIDRKFRALEPSGLMTIPALPDGLFPLQDALTTWALRRGRAAVFAGTGLGKTRIELAWSTVVHAAIGCDVLILAPLAVAAQIVREAEAMGLPNVRQVREQSEVQPGISVTNYDRLHKFDCRHFGAVALDESSCIKHQESKTLKMLMDAFAHAAFKLCATATPAPNDWTELGTHAEFLGVCTRTEMLSEFFVHDGGETQVWRLKKHARAQFWRWVSSWGAMVRKPSDLGFDDSLYILPPLQYHEHILNVDGQAQGGRLFALEAQTLSERRDARRMSMPARVEATAATVNASDRPWLVWCELNQEQDELERAFGDRAFSVRGADDADEKESRILKWIAGERPVMISKASIMGWGLNFQHCANQAFCSIDDSYEKFFQAVRRSWRFGQTQPVNVHIFSSTLEGAVLANIKRKEAAAEEMGAALSAETSASVREQVFGVKRMTNTYSASSRISVPSWLTSEVA